MGLGISSGGTDVTGTPTYPGLFRANAHLIGTGNSGKIVEPAKMIRVNYTGETDASRPMFPVGEVVDVKSTSSTSVVLPEAHGGTGTITYSMERAGSVVAGSVFNPATRTFTRQSSPGLYIYKATDANNKTAFMFVRSSTSTSHVFSPPSNNAPTLVFTVGIKAFFQLPPPFNSADVDRSLDTTPALPSGLQFDATKRLIYGTPNAAGTHTGYDFRSGSDVFRFNITVNAS